MLVPKLFTALRGYTRRQLLLDVSSGVVVGIVALPLAIAFAIASGVTPDRGLYTAIIAGFLISMLGGSRVQIGGPTGAFIVIVYGIVQQHGVEGLLAATIMAGIFLIGLGLARLGGAIKFIPYPVTTGFTAGIALIILTSQIKDFFGLRMGDVPAEFFAKWPAFAAGLDTVNVWAFAIASITVLIVAAGPSLSRRIPGPFVALILTTAAVQLFHLPVDTIGTRFGVINAAFPAPALPAIDPAILPALVGPAFTIALLCAIESLLSAVVADGMIGGRHRSNMELVAQGVANVVTPLFGGIPATGAIARTATNIKNGGRTPIAGITHAFVLLVITLFFGKWAALIPMPTLAGILVTVAYHMSGWKSFRAELRAPRPDVVVLLLTFVLTVVADLTVAIEVGMVVAAFLFMHKMASVTEVSAVSDEVLERPRSAEDEAPRSLVVPKDVQIYEINGPFFFGAAEKFKDTISRVAKPPRALIIRMKHVPAIDSTGLNALRDLVQRSRNDGTIVMLSDVNPQALASIRKSAVIEELGEGNIAATVQDALARLQT